MSKALRFLRITPEHQDRPFFYSISNQKNFIPKYLDLRSYRFRLNFTNVEATMGTKSCRDDFGRVVPSAKYYCKENK